ncbi:MAG: DUF4037 domain-containing protein [Aggregatilineales bacterium]
MPEFIAGLELGRIFYTEAVKPILDADFPDLRYAAAIIGSGSEVLGFDTALSSDHHWGPRVMLFVSPADHATLKDDIHEALANRLPYHIRGYTTNFGAPQFNDNGVQLLEAIDRGPVNHRVEIDTLENYILRYLGVDLADILSDTLTPVHWLTMTAQKLRTVAIGGAVFHDDSGDLTRLRKKLAYYPQDVWLYLLAAGWVRVAEEEPFMGRTGSVGDEIGSRVIASRLVHDLMNLCFLMEKQYAPYSKWFGTGFKQLRCAKVLSPIFESVLDAPVWQVREKHLTHAYEIVAEMHNALNITAPLPTTTSKFHTRPFQVIHAENFADAILAKISDPAVKRIADDTRIGSVEQLSNSTPFLSNTTLTRRARLLYCADG